MKARVSNAGRRAGPGIASARQRSTRVASQPSRAVGRPRDPRVDTRVLRATRKLLPRLGYGRLSIEAVARDAGIHRPAIYRRWRSKAELVHEAVYSSDDSRRIRITGDVSRDLRACVRATIELFTRPDVLAALPGLMADYREDPELRQRLVSRLGTAARASFARILSDAQARGEIDGAVGPDILFDALSGSIIFRILMSGAPRTEDLEEELTGLLLAGAGARTTRARVASRKRP